MSILFSLVLVALMCAVLYFVVKMVTKEGNDIADAFSAEPESNFKS